MIIEVVDPLCNPCTIFFFHFLIFNIWQQLPLVFLVFVKEEILKVVESKVHSHAMYFYF
jgi:hypothetical protein